MRNVRIGAAATSILALAPAAAGAAMPAKNATYVGTVAGKTVTVKISKKDNTRGRYTFDCGASGGPIGKWIALKVKSTGSFSGKDGAPYGGRTPIDSLKGKFTSKKAASATFSVTLCDAKGGKLTLKKK
jgi:hypothetical protein